MSVKATVQHLEGSRVALEVEVAPERVQESLKEAYQRLSQQVKIPGFRPGRVPPEVLRARLGRQSVYDEALERLLPRAFAEAVEAEGLQPVEQPRIDVVQMEEDKPLVFKAEVAVRPEVKLGPYTGVKVERIIHRVTEADVDEALGRLRERQAILEPVDEPVAAGHFVELDYEALRDGQPFRGGAARGRTVEVGKEQVVAGFDAAIAGMRAGDEREFELTVPADHEEPELAGRRLAFRVTVRAVKAKRLPELDDDLARSVGDFETLQALREDLRARLQEEADAESLRALRHQVTEKVAAAATVELPEAMVRRRTDTLVRNLADRLAGQGLTLERYLELTGRSASDLLTTLEPRARQELIEELTLDAVAAGEGVVVDPDELERRLQELMRPYEERATGAEAGGRGRRRRDGARRVDSMRQELREGLEAAMRREKAIDWLVAHADVETREIEGLERAPEPEAQPQPQPQPATAEEPAAAGGAGEAGSEVPAPGETGAFGEATGR